MAITESKIYSTYSSFSDTGEGSWSDVDNVKIDDATYATSSSIAYNKISALMFNFVGSLFSAIPDNAVINKVKISSTYRQAAGTGTWTGILYKGSDGNRTQLGSRTGSTGSVGTSFKEESYEYTGALSVSELKSSGLSFESKLLNRRLIGSVQYMRYAYIEITYTYEEKSFNTKLGVVDIEKIYLGNTEVAKVYKGGQEL